MPRCWAENPEGRPGFPEIAELLSDALRALGLSPPPTFRGTRSGGGWGGGGRVTGGASDPDAGPVTPMSPPKPGLNAVAWAEFVGVAVVEKPAAAAGGGEGAEGPSAPDASAA